MTNHRCLCHDSRTDAAREPQTLQQAILLFADYATCHAAMMVVRWPDGVVRCPRCDSDRVTYLAKVRRWKCYEKHPQAQFSLKVGTVLEDSPLPLEKWLPALWLLTNCKNGISSYELGRALGITQKSAWFMLHRLRLALQDGVTGGKLGGDVEADETYIGGKARNMHKGKRDRVIRGRGPSKVAVMGLLERYPVKGKSKVRTQVIARIKRPFIPGQVRKHVETGANLYTDALSSYAGLDGEYIHNVIDHAEDMPDVRADNPVGTLDRLVDGVRRVLSVRKEEIVDTQQRGGHAGRTPRRQPPRPRRKDN